ncbi:nucleotidyltransferase domain-containing protein [Sorangium sp. So ce145]|uniref:nucleotidyltransferase domain-containing protein n=1 Tax=Sorangium sp. So ce145 TaxID=3133285 RepID=UPI003F5EFD3E
MSPPMALADILRALVHRNVEFIVVGGMAAALQGAPVTTIDIDIVYSRSDDNIVRLMAALADLEAVFRTDPRRLVPNESHLRSTGHKLLQTKHGVLDVLATIEESTCYEDLLPDSTVLEVAGVLVRVLSLERLIEVKAKLTRPKDRAMLLLLQATLDEKRRAH